MKLRRSLAVAAATAAITPAVLLAAPTAFADDDPSASPSASVSAPAESESAPSGQESSPAAGESSPAAGESSPAAGESSPAASESAPSNPSTPPSASASASESTTPSASPSESTPPLECDSDEPSVDEDLTTDLSGLPSKIVAGSGFHNFKLNVDNSGDRAYQRVDFGVFAAQVDESDYFIDTSHLTLQYQDPASGKWVDISLDENDEGAGYLGYTDLRAHESLTIGLRLSVDKTAPAGLGYAISIGMYTDDQGQCVYSGGDSYYEFDILKAGSAPGDPGDAKPQGGKKPLPRQPSGNTEIDPQGHLAQTGSSSALPLIALTGGVAVAAGAGAVFVVRRRKAAGNGGATA
ncbi:LAETG motif-containing sortase-dependent surface protein [Streptomyces sp. NPDC048297]|uniref:LAETG motif-containing sortase-dependent surface protein n=1 Tax=Streptomyces sp. NPDC048297 TaxID=3365531 RepID=UPI0037147949